jgi:multicomponent Na+:H+ antiporter subunit C
MNVILAFLIGALFSVALYLMLRRNMVKLIAGLVILSHASHLLIFTSAGLVRGEPPLIAHESEAPPEVFADPLAQALILTAIVISFGLLAFTLVLVHRAYELYRTEDLHELKGGER